MIGIYKITNPTGKIYIGQSVNIEKRWNVYKQLHCKTQFKLYNSLQKYGVENHKFKVIEECVLEQLDERELYWSEYYNVLNENGLNLRIGKGRGITSEETKQKIGISNSKPKPIDFKEKCKFRKNVGSKKGVSKPKEFGFNHSLKMKDKGNKPILQIDISSGNIIKEWKSGKEASLFLNKVNSSSITACCIGRRKTAYGYYWKYKTK